MNFNKENCEVMHLRGNNPRHQYILVTNWKKSSLAEEDLGVLVDTKLNLTRQSAFATKTSWSAIGTVFPVGQGT